MFLGRLLAIYIRDVQLPERRQIAVDVSQLLAEHKTEMIIAEATVEAAEHAARLGLLFPAAIAAIEHDKQEDKGQLPGKEKATVTE